MQKTRTKLKPAHDLMMDILDLQRAIYRKAQSCGLARYLMDHGALAVIPHDHNGNWTADIELRFQPNHGVEYKLRAPVTGPDDAWPIDRDALSDLFVAHLQHLRANAEIVATNRRAIRQAALEVIAEAAQEGIALELLRIEAASILVYHGPERRENHAQVFYVHLMMPHDDAGTLTEDAYTIDADDADEFASYLRRRTIPELQCLLSPSFEVAAAA
ncbi:hypothetical protein [Sphingomonas faeni]|uniref:hypothetical protein n=1 Tax=Sphingomonas faeni TaxID=185950 RepID=UPI003346A16B